MAVLHLQITGVHFVLHSCDPLPADNGLKLTVGSRHFSQSRHRKYPDHMVGIHPHAWTSTWLSLSKLLRQLLPPPPQPSEPVTACHQLSAHGAVRTERSAVFDRSVFSARAGGGQMQHQSGGPAGSGSQPRLKKN